MGLQMECRYRWGNYASGNYMSGERATSEFIVSVSSCKDPEGKSSLPYLSVSLLRL